MYVSEANRKEYKEKSAANRREYWGMVSESVKVYSTPLSLNLPVE